MHLGQVARLTWAPVCAFISQIAPIGSFGTSHPGLWAGASVPRSQIGHPRSHRHVAPGRRRRPRGGRMAARSEYNALLL